MPNFPFDICKGTGVLINWLSKNKQANKTNHLIYSTFWFLWCKHCHRGQFQASNCSPKSPEYLAVASSELAYASSSWFQHTTGKSQIAFKIIGLIYTPAVCGDGVLRSITSITMNIKNLSNFFLTR